MIQNISLETLCFLIYRARELDVKEAVVEDDPASNASDDDFVEVLEDYDDDATAEELRQMIDSLNVDQQVELVALTWTGRGDFGPEEWAEAMAAARSRREGPTSTYLLGLPLLGDYLEEGLSQFGLSCVDNDEADQLGESEG
jgi:hypothetical protein